MNWFSAFNFLFLPFPPLTNFNCFCSLSLLAFICCLTLKKSSYEPKPCLLYVSSFKQIYAGTATPKSTPNTLPSTNSSCCLNGISIVKFNIKLLFLSNSKLLWDSLYSPVITLFKVCCNSKVFSFLALNTTLNTILLTHLIYISPFSS